jgi:polar amino acid transport system permease protein
MIYKILLDELPYLFQGVMVVLELAVGLLALGLVVGLGLAIMEVYGNRIAVIIATIIDQFFRGVPAAVLLFLFYYGFSDFYNISSFAAAILALGLRSGAYQSQIFKGAILAVP